MPWTLYGYIFKDLLKQLSIVTAVVVVVLSFGAAVEPISQGLLGPGSLVKVIAYSLPGMLPFALPFAAALAGTLVFSRIGSDNEITAALASGIGYRSLFTPVAFLGMLVTGSVFVLSNWIVPVFWQEVERELGEDIVQMMVKQIQNGKTVQIGSNVILYADRANMAPVTEPARGAEPQPYSRLILEGVAVGEMVTIKKEGTIPTRKLHDAHTARRAVIELYRDRDLGRVFATMLLRDVSIRDGDSNRFFAAKEQAINPIEIPAPIQQDPQFMSLPDLKRLVVEPKRSLEVRQAHRKLAEAVAAQQLLEAVMAESKKGKPMALESPGNLAYTLSAPSIVRTERQLNLSAVGDQKIEVLIKRQDRLTQRLLAHRGALIPTHKATDAEPRLNLHLEEVTITVTSLRGTEAHKLERIEPMLRLVSAEKSNLLAAPIEPLIAASEAYPEKVVGRPRQLLADEVQRLRLHVKSLLSARGAVAVSCLLVLLLGAVMSTLLRRQVPLVVFFWCFLPTILAFLSIHEGTKMLEQPGIAAATGFGMLWSGNGLLIVLILVAYSRLGRN